MTSRGAAGAGVVAAGGLVVPSFITSACFGRAERMYQIELIALGLLMKSVLIRLVSEVPGC